jgi:hypothetical protein
VIEQGLFKLIQSDAGVSALVTMTKNNGLYWILAPKSSMYPFIVLQRVATNNVHTMGGDPGIREALFQVDCYSSQYLNARAIAAAVCSCLGYYKGTLNDIDHTVVNSILVSKNWDLEYEEGSVGFVFRSMVEVRVWYLGVD